MKGLLRSLLTTLQSMADRPVTVQYPDQHLPLAPRYMGFPGLLWDFKVNEPACTGCQVCMRNCPTECITVTMKDNPKAQAGESKRRKIVDHFDIKVERCILCSICVEVCNFDAIAMSRVHEEGATSRGSLVADLPQLLEWGKDYQLNVRQSTEIKAGPEKEEA